MGLTRTGAGWMVVTANLSWFGGSGTAQLLRQDGASWQIVRSLPLPGAPSVLLRESPDSLLAVTGDYVVRIRDAARVEVLHRGELGLSGPNSLVKDTDGTLYLGASYLVIKLRPTPGGYEETWLAPNGATRTRPAEVSESPVSCADPRNASGAGEASPS